MPTSPRRLRIFVPLIKLPKPDESAGGRRFCAMLELLAKHHRVDLWSANEERLTSAEIDRYRALLTTAGVNVLGFGWERYVWALTSSYYHLGLFEFFETAVRFMADFTRRQPCAVTVVDSVDVHFERENAAVQLGLLDSAVARENQRRELATYREADAVIAVSEADAAILENEGGIRQLYVIPLIVPQQPRKEVAQSGEILFVGGFKHRPNIDGLRWFMRDVWPLIAAEDPSATLTIAGSHTPPEVHEWNSVRGVTVCGYVPEIQPLLDRTTISIAPLRYGSGVKGKIVEALASGVPVVTTSTGVQGLPVRIGTDLLVSDDARGFAHAVLSLLRDPERARNLGAAGQHAVKFCSPGEVERRLDHMVRTLVPHSNDFRLRLEWLRSASVHVLGVIGRRVTAKWKR